MKVEYQYHKSILDEIAHLRRVEETAIMNHIPNGSPTATVMASFNPQKVKMDIENDPTIKAIRKSITDILAFSVPSIVMKAETEDDKKFLRSL